jgi:hypothetical protein
MNKDNQLTTNLVTGRIISHLNLNRYILVIWLINKKIK